ncbi:hypothetical protein [Sphingobacterium sp. UBA5670]|uniref:hypothetical protein n=1 Tax=Sphingobacterium sp. UBA5670 TaxID=1947502 RepID=UPI0025DD83E7|nr:hypothetical protein [Sphingobacterium sp. UBA5670]
MKLSFLKTVCLTILLGLTSVSSFGSTKEREASRLMAKEVSTKKFATHTFRLHIGKAIEFYDLINAACIPPSNSTVQIYASNNGIVLRRYASDLSSYIETYHEEGIIDLNVSDYNEAYNYLSCLLEHSDSADPFLEYIGILAR